MLFLCVAPYTQLKFIWRNSSTICWANLTIDFCSSILHPTHLRNCLNYGHKQIGALHTKYRMKRTGNKKKRTENRKSKSLSRESGWLSKYNEHTNNTVNKAHKNKNQNHLWLWQDLITNVHLLGDIKSRALENCCSFCRLIFVRPFFLPLNIQCCCIFVR